MGTLRFWDSSSGTEIRKLDLSGPIGGMELSKDGNIITVAHGQSVSFINANSYEKIKEVAIPTTVFSASLIKDNSIFVCGGDDLKLYKYNYETGTEIGIFFMVIIKSTISKKSAICHPRFSMVM